MSKQRLNIQFSGYRNNIQLSGGTKPCSDDTNNSGVDDDGRSLSKDSIKPPLADEQFKIHLSIQSCIDLQWPDWSTAIYSHHAPPTSASVTVETVHFRSKSRSDLTFPAQKISPQTQAVSKHLQGTSTTRHHKLRTFDRRRSLRIRQRRHMISLK